MIIIFQWSHYQIGGAVDDFQALPHSHTVMHVYSVVSVLLRNVGGLGVDSQQG